MPEKKKQGGAMPEMKNATRLKNPAKVIKRLLSYLRGYTVRFIIVLVCIVISAGASAFSAMFIQLLIDNYIVPLMGQKNPDFTGLLIMLLTVLILSIVAFFLSNSTITLKLKMLSYKEIINSLYGINDCSILV